MYNNIQIYLSLKGGRNVFRPKDISFFWIATPIYTLITHLSCRARKKCSISQRRKAISTPLMRRLYLEKNEPIALISEKSR